MKLKKKIISLSIASALVLSACSTSGSSAAGKSTFAGTKEPDKQFAQILYTKDIGQKEFTQYIQSVGGITSQEKQDQAEKKYLELNRQALTSLKKLKVAEGDNKNYVASLVQLAELSEQINKAKNDYAKEYQEKGKLSDASRKQLESYQTQIQKAYQSAMEQEIALTENYAAAANGPLKDFLAAQRALNVELIQISKLQDRLYQDRTIKTENQFNSKAKPQLTQFANNVIADLNAIKSSDTAVNQYIASLTDYYRAKVEMIKEGPKIAAEQKRGKLSPAHTALIERFNRLDKETNNTRLELLKRFGS